jgi:hypothetical protein
MMSFVSLGIVPAGAIPVYAAYCAALLSRASEFPSAPATNLRHRAAKLPSQAGLILALALRRKRMFSWPCTFGLPQISSRALRDAAKMCRAIYNGFGTAALWSAST